MDAVWPLVPKIRSNPNLHSGKFEKNHYISRTSGQNQKLHFKDPHFFQKRMHLGFELALWDHWFPKYGQTLICTVGNLKKLLFFEYQWSKSKVALQRPPFFSWENASGLWIGAVRPLVPKIRPNTNAHSGKFEKIAISREPMVRIKSCTSKTPIFLVR